MELTGSTSIRQPIEVVWAALNNEEVLRQCITGCESLERIDAHSLVAKLAVKLGPVRAKFNGKVNISEVIPLQGYTLAFEGSGGAAGFAKGSSKVSLQARGDETLVSYTAQASVGGKLGQVGGRMIDATARSMADDFFKAFANTLGAEAVNANENSQEAAQLLAVSESTSDLNSASVSSKASPIPSSAALVATPQSVPLVEAKSKNIYWFIAGMVVATVLILIGKHWL
jgi:uncharacterized protein